MPQTRRITLRQAPSRLNGMQAATKYLAHHEPSGWRRVVNETWPIVLYFVMGGLALAMAIDVLRMGGILP